MLKQWDKRPIGRLFNKNNRQVLTRNESIGDRIEFSIKKDIPIRFVKKLLEAKLPYHPEANTIEILWNDSIVDDNTMVYSLVYFDNVTCYIIEGWIK